MRKNIRILLLVFGCHLLVAGAVCADTIRTNDGKELKGIVVEDYKDRILFSTADGEITINKSDIRELYLDNEEDNLVKLAEQATEKGDYVRAFVYYDKAYKLNPESKRAKDGLVFLQGFLFRRDQAQKEEAVRRQEDYENFGQPTMARKSEEEEAAQNVKELKDTTGIGLQMKDGFPEVESVRPGSFAYQNDIRKGDRFVSIWGRLTGYMSLREVLSLLLEKSMEVKCDVERTMTIPKGAPGVTFKMEFNGLTVSNIESGAAGTEYGLKVGDLITYIDGKTTRYTPFKEALEAIREPKGDGVNLTIKREITIWKK